MTREDQLSHNQLIIDRVLHLVRDHRSCHTPSYKQVTSTLNTEQLFTSRGNAWTCKSLFRMLQRSGIRGLYGIARV